MRTSPHCGWMYIMAETRLSIAKKDIVACFDAQPRRVFRREEIARLLRSNREGWRLAQRTGLREFIAWLTERAFLRPIPLEFTQRKPITVYVWRTASPHEVALATGPREKTCLGYFTAAAFHDLTLQTPNTIHVCIEQPPKKSARPALTQEMIDAAFAKSPRVSQARARWKGWNILLVNTVYSGGLGVYPMESSVAGGYPLRATDLERTLIDLTVRPHYGGGPAEVLDCFRRAAARVSVNRLRSYLQKLGYLYPYHQAIGFYLEAAGIERKRLQPLESFPVELDFPLAHGIPCPLYSRRWRVRYPEGLRE